MPAATSAAGTPEGGLVTSQGGPAAETIQTEDVDQIGLTSSLMAIAAVARYAKRIGAEERSLRKLVVREDAGRYRRDVAEIIFIDGPDKIVTVEAPADFAPNAVELEEISAGWKNRTWPEYKPYLFTGGGDPPSNGALWGKAARDNLAFCRSAEGDTILAIEERRHRPDGSKDVYVWTYWSDRAWRITEPPGGLPLFGLDTIGDAATIFVHEGPKAAKATRDLIDEHGGAWASHPFGRELRGETPGSVAHVGWMGGAERPMATNWEAVAARPWRRVVIVADNDEQGLRAARLIARQFPAKAYILSFDQRFDPGFDLADEWPRHLFDDNGAYTGPTFDECLIPATQATIVLPPEGRGRPTILLRREFASTVAYTLDPLRFVHRHLPSRDRSAIEFNALVAPFSDAKDTAAKVVGQIQCQHDKLIYHPGHNPGSLLHGGLRCFNVYEPPKVRANKGDDAPWLEYLDHLFPIEPERLLVMTWLATLIAKPGVRMRYGLLLVSISQGVGKNTLAAALKLLIGRSNISFPSEQSVVDSQFNGWLARRRLIFIAEIYSGHSRKAYDKLKSVLADDDIEVNEKNIPQYHLDNWATVIACSNSEAAIRIDDEDRRWLVPTVTECLQAPEYWAGLYKWLAGDGPGIIRQWALDHIAAHGHVRTGDHAPGTDRKKVIAHETKSDGEKLAFALAEHLASHEHRAILRVSAVRSWIAGRRGFVRNNGEADVSDRRLEKPGTILAVMKKVPGITVWADKLRPKFGATRKAVIMNFAPSGEEDWAAIKGEVKSLEDIGGGLDADM